MSGLAQVRNDKKQWIRGFFNFIAKQYTSEVVAIMKQDGTRVGAPTTSRWGDTSSSSSASSYASSSSYSSSSYSAAPAPASSSSLQYGQPDSDDSDSDDDSESQRQARQGRHYALEISHRILCNSAPALAFFLVHRASRPDGQLVWQYFERAVVKYQRTLLTQRKHTADFAGINPEHVVKHNVHVRLVDLCGGLMKPNVSSIRSENAGQFIQIQGTATRAGMIKMVESTRAYRCSSSRCNLVFKTHAEVDQGYAFEEPRGCPQDQCKSTRADHLPELSTQRDCQELRVQEHATRLAVGSIPRSILVVLEDDLVDSCKAGDDVMITGVVRRRWKPLMRDRRCEVELYVLANAVQVSSLAFCSTVFFCG
jgi:DNA replicative helicase MCM subunit Mcm2 (Cdc46/Mcm family)